MRLRKRYLIAACASVAALSVGGVAYGHDGNVSSACRLGQVAPGALPGNGTGPSGSGPLANVSFSIQTHTNYGHPGIPEPER